MKRRHAAAGLSLLPLAAWAQDKPALRRVGLVSMLGDSVRIVALKLEEVRFRELRMDELVAEVVGGGLRSAVPGVQVEPYRPPAQVSVQNQVDLGTAAARRAELPEWLPPVARATAPPAPWPAATSGPSSCCA